LEAANVCIRGTKFPWVGWLLSMVHSKLVQDCEANIKKRMQEDDPKDACFHKDAEGTLWFKETLVVLEK
jgi:hypothetical protein